MESVTKLIVWVIGLGFSLLAAGQLPKATKLMMIKAIKAQRSTLSLSKLSRALNDGDKY